jgi:hypothetical protein
MVRLTRIYTRTGDAGDTRLGDMSVARKTDLEGRGLRRCQRGQRAPRDTPW